MLIVSQSCIEQGSKGQNINGTAYDRTLVSSLQPTILAKWGTTPCVILEILELKCLLRAFSAMLRISFAFIFILLTLRALRNHFIVR